MGGLEQFIPWSDYLNGDFDHIEPALTYQHEPSIDADGTFWPLGEDWSNAAQEDLSTPIHMALLEPAFPANDSSLTNGISFQNASSHEPANLEGLSSANVIQSPTEDKLNMPQRKSRTVFSSDAHFVVRGWLDAHADDPYPTNEEKEQFSHSLQLSVKQISTLFNNERRRYNKDSRDPKCILSSSLSSHGNIHLGKPDSPLERYLSSSPEDDPQPMETVASAAADFEATSIVVSERYGRTSRHTKKRRLSGSEDGTSSDIRSPSDISTGQESSLSSENSYSSHTSGKKGKRRTQVARPSTSGKGRYYCTSCWKNFHSGAAWRKHETTVHNPQHEFECRMAELRPTILNCGGCSNAIRGCQKGLDHNYTACEDRTKEARTFHRKDHFMNHMSGIHKAEINPTIQSWMRFDVHKTKSRCGFCGKWFPTWIERLDHIGEHYRYHDDFDQSAWKETREEEESIDAACPQPNSSKDYADLGLVPYQEQDRLQFEITALRNGCSPSRQPHPFFDFVLRCTSLADWEAVILQRLLKHTSSTTHEDGKFDICPQGYFLHHKDCSAKRGGLCKFDLLKGANIVGDMVSKQWRYEEKAGSF